MMDIFEANQQAWDQAAVSGSNPYAKAVSAAEIEAARSGAWSIWVSDLTPVPTSWLVGVEGLDVLALAAGRRSAGASSRRCWGACHGAGRLAWSARSRSDGG